MAFGSKEISFKFRANWLILIWLLAIVLVILYVRAGDEARKELVFAAAVLAGSAGLTTAANNIDSRVSSGRQARVVAAMDFIARWNDPTFYHCKKAGRDAMQFFKENQNVDTQIGYLKQDPQRYANLIDVLNVFESLSIAIDKDAVDDETAKRFFRSLVARYWHLTENIIKKERAEHANARLYQDFEKLYNRWK